MTYAIWIPIKLGSRRFPGKNIKQFNGRSLYQITFDLAKKLGYPIYVTSDFSFDDPDIHYIQENYEHNPSDPNSIRTSWRKSFDSIPEEHIIMLQVTSPLRTLDIVKECIQRYENNGKRRAVVSVDFNYYPTGACYIWPRDTWLWDNDLFLVFTEKWVGDIDYYFQFKIAEAVERGDHC